MRLFSLLVTAMFMHLTQTPLAEAQMLGDQYKSEDIKEGDGSDYSNAVACVDAATEFTRVCNAANKKADVDDLISNPNADLSKMNYLHRVASDASGKVQRKSNRHERKCEELYRRHCAKHCSNKKRPKKEHIDAFENGQERCRIQKAKEDANSQQGAKEAGTTKEGGTEAGDQSNKQDMAKGGENPGEGQGGKGEQSPQGQSPQGQPPQGQPPQPQDDQPPTPPDEEDEEEEQTEKPGDACDAGNDKNGTYEVNSSGDLVCMPIDDGSSSALVSNAISSAPIPCKDSTGAIIPNCYRPATTQMAAIQADSVGTDASGTGYSTGTSNRAAIMNPREAAKSLMDTANYDGKYNEALLESVRQKLDELLSSEERADHCAANAIIQRLKEKDIHSQKIAEEYSAKLAEKLGLGSGYDEFEVNLLCGQ